MCVGCGSQIHDQYILRVAPDLEWHASCLKCADCHTYLDETCTCFVRDGKTYCKRDYVRWVRLKRGNLRVSLAGSGIRDSVDANSLFNNHIPLIIIIIEEFKRVCSYEYSGVQNIVELTAQQYNWSKAILTHALLPNYGHFVACWLHLKKDYTLHTRFKCT